MLICSGDGLWLGFWNDMDWWTIGWQVWTCMADFNKKSVPGHFLFMWKNIGKRVVSEVRVNFCAWTFDDFLFYFSTLKLPYSYDKPRQPFVSNSITTFGGNTWQSHNVRAVSPQLYLWGKNYTKSNNFSETFILTVFFWFPYLMLL